MLTTAQNDSGESHNGNEAAILNELSLSIMHSCTSELTTYERNIPKEQLLSCEVVLTCLTVVSRISCFTITAVTSNKIHTCAAILTRIR